jgi:tRNA G46 methylase TrmB
VLVAGGEVRFTTDHEGYFNWAMEHWSQAPGWRDGGTWDATEDPRTDFELLFREEGRMIYRRRWLKA